MVNGKKILSAQCNVSKWKYAAFLMRPGLKYDHKVTGVGSYRLGPWSHGQLCHTSWHIIQTSKQSWAFGFLVPLDPPSLQTAGQPEEVEIRSRNYHGLELAHMRLRYMLPGQSKDQLVPRTFTTAGIFPCAIIGIVLFNVFAMDLWLHLLINGHMACIWPIMKETNALPALAL